MKKLSFKRAEKRKDDEYDVKSHQKALAENPQIFNFGNNSRKPPYDYEKDNAYRGI